jgi:hypothetical protein
VEKNQTLKLYRRGEHMMSCIWYAVKCQIYFTELKLISKLTNLKAIETISLY